MPIRLTPQPARCSGRGYAATRFPPDGARVSGAVCWRGSLPLLLGRVSLARRLPLPAVQARPSSGAAGPTALAVQGLRVRHVGDCRYSPAPDAHPADLVVLGSLSGHHAHAGNVRAPAPTAVGDHTLKPTSMNSLSASIAVARPWLRFRRYLVSAVSGNPRPTRNCTVWSQPDRHDPVNAGYPPEAPAHPGSETSTRIR